MKTSIPFKDKMLLSRAIGTGMSKLVSSVEFDRNYIESHSREDYLSIGDQLCKKIDAKDYYVDGQNLVVFLDVSTKGLKQN